MWLWVPDGFGYRIWGIKGVNIYSLKFSNFLEVGHTNTYIMFSLLHFRELLSGFRRNQSCHFNDIKRLRANDSERCVHLVE